jgi:hypothetical protein
VGTVELKGRKNPLRTFRPLNSEVCWYSVFALHYGLAGLGSPMLRDSGAR